MKAYQIYGIRTACTSCTKPLITPSSGRIWGRIRVRFQPVSQGLSEYELKKHVQSKVKQLGSRITLVQPYRIRTARHKKQHFAHLGLGDDLWTGPKISNVLSVLLASIFRPHNMPGRPLSKLGELAYAHIRGIYGIYGVYGEVIYGIVPRLITTHSW